MWVFWEWPLDGASALPTPEHCVMEPYPLMRKLLPKDLKAGKAPASHQMFQVCLSSSMRTLPQHHLAKVRTSRIQRDYGPQVNHPLCCPPGDMWIL